MRWVAILALLALSGCSTAGPFVMGISSDGTGGITVEKCLVHFNAFLGVVSNSDCNNENIRLATISTPEQKPKRTDNEKELLRQ